MSGRGGGCGGGRGQQPPAPSAGRGQQQSRGGGPGYYHYDVSLEYWTGVYQSLRPTQMGLSLHIDTSARAFFEPICVSDFVGKYLNKDLTRPLSDQDRVKVKKALRGLRVEVSHQGHIKRYTVSGLTPESAQHMMFTLDDSGTRISVSEYFRQKYNIVLKYPMLPAIQVGNDTNPNYFPMEVCKIVDGQRYSKKLNERQVTALLRATCQRPLEREKSIRKMVDYNNYNIDALVNTEFGIDVNPELTSIEARVLPSPMIERATINEIVNDAEPYFDVIINPANIGGTGLVVPPSFVTDHLQGNIRYRDATFIMGSNVNTIGMEIEGDSIRLTRQFEEFMAQNGVSVGTRLRFKSIRSDVLIFDVAVLDEP